MSLDLSQDFEVFDDPVAVSYRACVSEGQYDAAEYVEGCQLTAVTKDDVTASPALLTKQSVVLHAWRKCLGLIVPKAKDRFQVDAGDCDPDVTPAVYVVQSVTVADRDRRGPQRFRLVATRSTGAQTL